MVIVYNFEIRNQKVGNIPKTKKSNFSKKVGFLPLYTFNKPETNPTANPMGILGLFISLLKVRKTPDFFRNPVFFMVAEAGLRSATDRLSLRAGRRRMVAFRGSTLRLPSP